MLAGAKALERIQLYMINDRINAQPHIMCMKYTVYIFALCSLVATTTVQYHNLSDTCKNSISRSCWRRILTIQKKEVLILIII